MLFFPRLGYLCRTLYETASLAAVRTLMDILSLLPPLQATLNTVAAGLTLGAYYCIRRQDTGGHRTLMIVALFTSGLFLVSYLVYHQRIGYVPFVGTGVVRPVYFAILVTHVVAAATIVPLVLVTLVYALRGQISGHRRVARWTLPLWLYSSVTGILVYLLAFQIYPS